MSSASFVQAGAVTGAEHAARMYLQLRGQVDAERQWTDCPSL